MSGGVLRGEEAMGDNGREKESRPRNSRLGAQDVEPILLVVVLKEVLSTSLILELLALSFGTIIPLAFIWKKG